MAGLYADRAVPFRWPSSWTEPGLIRLLEGGPVNCLLFEGASPVMDAARKASLEVREAGTLEAVSGLAWPRVKPFTEAATAGPTGAPWIDSNCWVARLARVRAPAKPVWLTFEPPAQEPAPSETAYRIAIADSAASGARWVVSLHAAHSRGVAAGDGTSLKIWKSILDTLSFFEKHHEWRAYEPWGAVGILSSFAGSNQFLGSEVLNLAARGNLLYRILDRAMPASHKLDGLRGVLYVDDDPPSADLKARLTAFARGGGLLIVPRSLAAAFPGERALACPVAGYELRSFGKGSLATALRTWDDPYFLAAEVHSLVSRRNDPVLLFNARTLWEHYSVAPGGQGELLQLVGFTGRPNESVSVAAARPSRSATMYTPESDSPQVLQSVKVEGRTEYHLPAFSSFAALEFKS